MTCIIFQPQSMSRPDACTATTQQQHPHLSQRLPARVLKYRGKRRADAVQESTTGAHLKRVSTPGMHGRRGNHLAGDVAAEEEVDERLDAAAPGGEQTEGRLQAMIANKIHQMQCPPREQNQSRICSKKKSCT